MTCKLLTNHYTIAGSSLLVTMHGGSGSSAMGLGRVVHAFLSMSGRDSD